MKQAGAHFIEKATSPPGVALPPAGSILRTDTTSFIAGTAIIPVNSLIKD